MSPGKKRPPRELRRIGWREWVALPDLGIGAIKAKIDSGARSSALHAIGIQRFVQGGRPFVRFKVHPDQRDSKRTIEAVAPVLEKKRKVKSSTGHVTERPVILSRIEIFGESFEIELTLVPRGEMGFRLLLGRQAFRDRFLVDASRSFLNGRPRRKKKKARRGSKT